MQRAYAAEARDELDALLADLPAKAPRTADAARPARKRRFAPGIVAFSERADVDSARRPLSTPRSPRLYQAWGAPAITSSRPSARR